MIEKNLGKITKIRSQEELVRFITAFKKKSLYMLLPKQPLNSGMWNSNHSVVEYQNELINIKVPNLLAYIVGPIVEPALSFIFDDSFFKSQSAYKNLVREAEIYARLFSEGFPTLEPMQELIKYNGNDLVDGVVLTKRVTNIRLPLQEISGYSISQKIDYAEKTFRLISDLYNQHNIIWPDAVVKNTMYNEDKLLLFDFGSKVNDDVSQDTLQRKVIENFCFSLQSIAKLTPAQIAKAFTNSYDCSKGIISSLESEIERYETNNSNTIDRIKANAYLGIRLGVSYEEIIGMRTALVNALSQDN